METQNKQILRHLQSGRPITSLEAIRLFGCLRLSGRIYDLRKIGHPILSKRVSTLTGKHIAEYRYDTQKT